MTAERLPSVPAEVRTQVSVSSVKVKVNWDAVVVSAALKTTRLLPVRPVLSWSVA